jgi:hypothetical protein
MAAKAIAPRKGVVAPITRGRENDELAAVEDIIEIGECSSGRRMIYSVLTDVSTP